MEQRERQTTSNVCDKEREREREHETTNNVWESELEREWNRERENGRERTRDNQQCMGE